MEEKKIDKQISDVAEKVVDKEKVIFISLDRRERKLTVKMDEVGDMKEPHLVISDIPENVVEALLGAWLGTIGEEAVSCAEDS